jgi:hypothetical protein
MANRDLRIIRVPRWVTVTLLLRVSVAIAALIWFLSGKAVYREASPLRLDVSTGDRELPMGSSERLDERSRALDGVIGTS